MDFLNAPNLFYFEFFLSTDFFLGFYKITLFLKLGFSMQNSSNEDDFEPSRMLLSHLQPQTPKTWQTRARGGVGALDNLK